MKFYDEVSLIRDHGLLACHISMKNRVKFAGLPKLAEVEDTISNFIIIGYII